LNDELFFGLDLDLHTMKTNEKTPCGSNYGWKQEGDFAKSKAAFIFEGTSLIGVKEKEGDVSLKFNQ